MQIPANADHPSHRVAAEVAASEPFRAAMGGTPPPDQVAVNVLAPEQYAILLDHLGASRQHVRLQVYGHTLARSADVVEWVKGTSLTRFTNVLPADLHERVPRHLLAAPPASASATRRRTSTRSSGSCSGVASLTQA